MLWIRKYSIDRIQRLIINDQRYKIRGRVRNLTKPMAIVTRVTVIA